MTRALRIALIVPFLDEAAHLPVLLDSLAAQARRPDRVLLVDDGSTDGSASIAAGFAAAHPYAQLLRRPPRPPEQDRMARAHEWYRGTRRELLLLFAAAS